MFLSVPYTIIYNCCTLVLMNSGLSPKKKNFRKFFPVHEVLDKIEPDLLPALHALTGRDSTSKVSTKVAALRTTIEGGGELFLAFGWSVLTDDMIANAEKFLTRCFSARSKCTHFDDLRYDVYHEKEFQFDRKVSGDH